MVVPRSAGNRLQPNEAGLSPQQVVRAATLTPAQVLEIDDEVGSIAVGKRAELVVFAADLHADFNAVRTPSYVVHDGEMRTPAGWMQVEQTAGTTVTRTP